MIKSLIKTSSITFILLLAFLLLPACVESNSSPAPITPISKASTQQVSPKKIIIKYSTKIVEQLGQYQKPSNGYVYLVLSFDIENNGYESFGTNPLYFSATVNNVKYSNAWVSTENDLKPLDLLDGGRTQGDLVFEIPSSDANSDFQINYSGILGSFDIQWLLQPISSIAEPIESETVPEETTEAPTVITPSGESTSDPTTSEQDKPITDSNNGRDVVIEQIKSNASEKWGDDAQMVEYEVTNQTEAYDWVMGQTAYPDIMERAVLEWDEDYQMVQYEYENQVDSYEWAELQTAYPEIMERAKQQWGGDYEMVKYEYENQVDAYEWIIQQTAYPDIMEAALQKWGDDYEMVKYEYENQVNAR